MKSQWMGNIQVSGWMVILAGSLVGALALPGWAQENATQLRVLLRKDHEGRQQPARTVKEWVAQIEATTVQVTGVKLEPTEDGLDIVLETAEGKPLQVDATKFRREANSLIADVPSAVLALPEGQSFAAENPIADIATVQVVQQNADTIRVQVTGTNALPKTDVTLRTGGFAYSLNSEEGESDDEIVVTGDRRDGYNPTNSGTATGTNTPIHDTPFSIQVVPQQVLVDRNVTELGNALETVGGVVSAGGRGNSVFGPNFLIRGFDVTASVFRDRIPSISLAPLSTNDIERVEVLKGPASVLFGQGNPGGIINLVSKIPLAEPLYSVSFTAGSFDTYRGGIDFSGPLNDAKTVRYRLNLSYENYGSFRDFVNGERFIVSPVLAWDIGPNASLSIYGQYTYDRETLDEGIVAIGDRIANIPRDRFLGEPFAEFNQEQFNVGYRFNHRFNDSLSVRHALQYTEYDPQRYSPFADTLDEETGELTRGKYNAGGTYKRFFTNAEVLGKL